MTSALLASGGALPRVALPRAATPSAALPLTAAHRYALIRVLALLPVVVAAGAGDTETLELERFRACHPHRPR
jgi:hypothetical protein